MDDIKPILKEYTEEVKRHMSVLEEGFKNSVHIIAEQYDSINEKLDSHGKKLDSHDKRFSSIDDKLDSHDKKLSSIDEKLDSHTEMIGEMKEDIIVIKMDMDFVKNSLKKKVDAEEFEILEKRVGVLESKTRMA
jgi:septation ring formation regulator EzrA